MKKMLVLLLAVVMCFSLVACGESKETSNTNEPQTNQITENKSQIDENSTQLETESTKQEESVEDVETVVNLVGKWECKEIERVLVLHEDGVAEFTDYEEVTWEYNNTSKTLYLSFNELNTTTECTYNGNDDVIVFNGAEFSRVVE